MQRKPQDIAFNIASSSLIALTLLGSASQSASARTYQYHGLIELDYGSSIVGAPKHSRYFVDFILDGTKLDTGTAFLRMIFTTPTASAVLQQWGCLTKS